MKSFGLASVKEEGTPIDPYSAMQYTGPGAAPEWFKRQCVAYFNHRRSRGDTEESLLEQYGEYYIPPSIGTDNGPSTDRPTPK